MNFFVEDHMEYTKFWTTSYAFRYLFLTTCIYDYILVTNDMI